MRVTKNELDKEQKMLQVGVGMERTQAKGVGGCRGENIRLYTSVSRTREAVWEEAGAVEVSRLWLG